MLRFEAKFCISCVLHVKNVNLINMDNIKFAFMYLEKKADTKAASNHKLAWAVYYVFVLIVFGSAKITLYSLLLSN